jgi:activator of HSP90 ATPase
MFEAFTNDKMMTAYLQAPVEIDAKVGGKFSYFNGNISGEFVELASPNHIRMKWRMKQWKENEYSDVDITFKTLSNTEVVMIINQTHIPEHDSYGNRDVPRQVLQGWENYFIRGIRNVLGYAKVDLDD